MLAVKLNKLDPMGREMLTCVTVAIRKAEPEALHMIWGKKKEVECDMNEIGERFKQLRENISVGEARPIEAKETLTTITHPRLIKLTLAKMQREWSSPGRTLAQTAGITYHSSD